MGDKSFPQKELHRKEGKILAQIKNDKKDKKRFYVS